ncbi:hypothetical protein D9M71_621690 [compost metagenome]
MGHAFRRHGGDRFGQLQCRWVGSLEEQVVVRQLAHLFGGHFNQLFTAVTDRHAPQARHAIEDLVALAVPQVHALGLGDDPRPLLLQLFIVTERCQVMLTAKGLPLTGLRVVDAHVLLRLLTAAVLRLRVDQTANSRNSRSQELITRLKFSCSARLVAT